MHFNIPRFRSVGVMRLNCPFCDRYSLVFTASQEWYEPELFCLRCFSDLKAWKPTLENREANRNRRKIRNIWTSAKAKG